MLNININKMQIIHLGAVKESVYMVVLPTRNFPIFMF